MEEEIINKIPILVKETGRKFPTSKSSNQEMYGIFICPFCGTHWETMVRFVKSGKIRSCGCQNINVTGITHGLTSNRFYSTWYKMVDRCTNPESISYSQYGARGISVCDEWKEVSTFIRWCVDTHPNVEGLSLDRIDNDGNYHPSNCRWADRSTQAINQRKYKNNTSGFVGVKYNKKSDKWEVQIGVNKKRVYLGQYFSKEEAIWVRDKYILDNNLPHKLSIDYINETK